MKNQGNVANTPITAMMELRNWQTEKIMQTYVNPEVCDDNILSNEMIKILDFKENESSKKFELC